MDWLQIIVLALVQGITEFLPISSSAHLILVAEFGGWEDQGLAFDVAVHLGTLTAVCLYLRHDLGRYLSSRAGYLGGHGADQDFRELLKVAIATLPVVVGGLLLSQLLTLYTTPVIYLWMDRLRLRWGTVWSRRSLQA